MCPMFDSVAPKEQPAYVPKKRRKRKSCLSIVLFDTFEKCATTITECINNMKVRRRSHPPKLRYSRHRPKCKKGKHVLSAALTGMTMTWTSDRIAPSGTFDSDSQALMLDMALQHASQTTQRITSSHPKGSTERLRGSKAMLRPHIEAP